MKDDFLSLPVNAYFIDYCVRDVLRYLAQVNSGVTHFQPHRCDNHKLMPLRFFSLLFNCGQCGDSETELSVVPLSLNFFSTQKAAGNEEVVGEFSVHLLRYVDIYTGGL